jgi:hypothetical protein
MKKKKQNKNWDKFSNDFGDLWLNFLAWELRDDIHEFFLFTQKSVCVQDPKKFSFFPESFFFSVTKGK